jgi:hypothetical protein
LGRPPGRGKERKPPALSPPVASAFAICAADYFFLRDPQPRFALALVFAFALAFFLAGMTSSLLLKVGRRILPTRETCQRESEPRSGSTPPAIGVQELVWPAVDLSTDDTEDTEEASHEGVLSAAHPGLHG